jgi:hypothetical protein
VLPKGGGVRIITITSTITPTFPLQGEHAVVVFMVGNDEDHLTSIWQ